MTVTPGDAGLSLSPQPGVPSIIRFRKGALRDREASRLKALGWDLRRIGEYLGLDTIPEYTEARVAAAIRRALAATSRFVADESRWLELAGYEEIELYLWRLLNTRQVLVSHGRVVSVDNTPLEDHRFGLDVVDRLCRVKAQKAKLMGWNAPNRMQLLTADTVEDEIKKLETEISANAAADAIARQFPEDEEAAG